MRTYTIYLIIGLLVFTYGLLNFYIGLRGWQALARHIALLNSKIYWTMFWFISFSFIIGRIGQKYLPTAISRGLAVIGSYWLAAMFYLVLLLVLIDVIRLMDRVFRFLPEGWRQGSSEGMTAGFVVLALLGTVLAYGAWNARHPRVTGYDLTIPKKVGGLDGLNIVLVSDIHLGTIVDNRRLNRMVDLINELKPDLVLLAGDIIDEDVEVFAEQQMAKSFRRLKPRLGTFAVFGNHEYIGGHAEEAAHYLTQGGVQVIRDRFVKVAGSFYVVGREDRSAERFGPNRRKELGQVMEGVDRNLPVLLMDHQPFNLEEAAEQGVDLQVSGHTHRGQLFPNHLITRRIFEIDWGHLKKDSLNVIVSSGYGTWGPPIRTGNVPEIVNIKLSFGK